MLEPLRIALLALAALLVVATVLPLVRKPYWWIRSFDFPRAQIAALAAATLAALVAVVLTTGLEGSLDTAALIGLGATVLYQAARMAPYTALWRVQTVDAVDPDRDRSLRLVVSNVLMTNRDGARWLGVVRGADPDIVAAVETDAWWAETAGALKATHPHAVELPQDDTYGMCLYSRYPLAEVEVQHLIEPEVPSLFLSVELPSGERVRLVVLHPRPPRPDIGQDSTLRDAELVLAARAIVDGSGPVVVCGDLNDVAWSRTTTLFQKIAGLLDPRVGRGLYSTFHAHHRLLRYPLDHVFHSDDLALVALTRLGNAGSDHFPMCVELALSSAAAEQEAPPASADAHEQAADVLDEAHAFKADESAAEAAERKADDV